MQFNQLQCISTLVHFLQALWKQRLLLHLLWLADSLEPGPPARNRHFLRSIDYLVLWLNILNPIRR